MTVAVFDTLKLAKRLEAAGMPAPQAAGFAEALSDVMTTELATKSDLRELRGWAMTEFAGLRGEFAGLRGEFAGLRAEVADLRAELKETRAWASAEFADVRREMRTGFADVRTEFARLRTEMAVGKAETVRWMVGLFIAQTSVTVGVLLRLAG